MTEDEIKAVLAEAMQKTSARAAKLSFVVEPDPGTWVIVLQSKGEELAISLSVAPNSTRESVRQDVIQQLQRLF